MKPLIAAALVFLLSAAAIVYLVAPTDLWPARPRDPEPPTAAEAASARVDELFAAWNRPDSPGCSVGVSQNGLPVHERGYGRASLELGVPITPATVFHVASISKQFTAMSVVLLAQRGQLSLDDSVRKHLPDLPDYGSPLMLRHLLTHTGGLRDPFLLAELAAPAAGMLDTEGIVALLARQRALNFTPGTEFQYSNGGYALLASIVQRVSGLSLRAFAEANIFTPLGMAATHIHDDPGMVVPNRATGYATRGGEVHLAPHPDLGHIVGTTALFTTARDLLVWQQHLAEPRIGDPAMVAAMQTPTALAGGASSPYGFGLQLGQHRGLRTIGHGGGDPGVAAHVVRFPDHQVAVAVLCNLEDIGSTLGDLARQVGEIYLEGVLPGEAAPAPPAATAATLSAEELAARIGVYRDPTDETFGRLFTRNGVLMATDSLEGNQGVELTATSVDRFVAPGTPIVIELLPVVGAQASEIRVSGAGPKPVVMQKIGAFTPSARDLRALAGSYVSSELDVAYTIVLRDADVIVQRPGRPEITLRPVYPDTFHGPVVNVVKFARDASGIVTGLTVRAAGVRALRFDRVRRPAAVAPTAPPPPD